MRHARLPSKVASTGGICELSAGTELFREGGRGGSLYIVREGSIELYQQRGGQEVPVATLGPGEVLGLNACLLNEPRQASARVREDLVALQVDGDEVQVVLRQMPKWLGTIVQALIRQIKDLKQELADERREAQDLRKNQLTRLYTATQMAATLVAMGDSLARKVDGRKLVFVDDALTCLETMLCRPRDQLGRLFEVILASGLIRLELDVDRKAKVFDAELLRRLAFFVQFAGSLKSTRTKKLLRARFSFRERRTLYKLVALVKEKGLDPGTVAKLPLAELTETLPLDTLERAAKAGLVTIEGLGPAAKLVFGPSTLTQTLACLELVRKLSPTAADTGDDEDAEAREEREDAIALGF